MACESSGTVCGFEHDVITQQCSGRVLRLQTSSSALKEAQSSELLLLVTHAARLRRSESLLQTRTAFKCGNLFLQFKNSNVDP